MFGEIPVYFGDQLRVVSPVAVQPEDDRRAGRFGTADRKFDLVLYGFVFDTAQPPDVAGLDLMLMNDVTVSGQHTNAA